jgi:hypothetical protein
VTIGQDFLLLIEFSLFSNTVPTFRASFACCCYQKDKRGEAQEPSNKIISFLKLEVLVLRRPKLTRDLPYKAWTDTEDTYLFDIV